MKIAGFEPWDRQKVPELALAIILHWLKPKLDRFELKFDQHFVPSSLIIGGNYREFSHKNGRFSGSNKNRMIPDVIKTGCNKNSPE